MPPCPKCGCSGFHGNACIYNRPILNSTPSHIVRGNAYNKK